MKFTAKRKAGGRSRANQGRKKYRRMNVPRSLSVSRANIGRDVHYFKRSFSGNNIAGNAGYAPFLGAYAVNLANLPNVSEFANLFDRYMITHWQVRLYLKIDPSAQTAATASYPRVFTVKDYDDDTAPASLDALREHAHCKTQVLTPYKPVIVNIKPAVLAEVYRSGIYTSYSPKWKQWLDMATTGVTYYGFKLGIDDLTNTNYSITIENTLWFRCKDTR